MKVPKYKEDVRKLVNVRGGEVFDFNGDLMLMLCMPIPHTSNNVEGDVAAVRLSDGMPLWLSRDEQDIAVAVVNIKCVYENETL